MKFKINKVSERPELSVICNALLRVIMENGNDLVELSEDANFVLNLIDLRSPKAYRRKSQEEMVVSVTLISEPEDDPKSACYVALVKSISNILFCIDISDGKSIPRAFSITPEVGFVEFDYEPARMYYYMYPVISSHFVLRNKICENFHPEHNRFIPEVEDLIEFGKELNSLGVLPAPFPLTSYLDQDLINQLYRLYQIKGLSYGNLSIRNSGHQNKGISYWMTARGVNKSELKGVGKDILLVTGFNEKNGEMIVSVPNGYDPRIRVSVDAIEHYHIYREFPETGAIVHLHAWMDNIICTSQSFPCGTRELAENVVELLRRTASPERAVVGLKNHGITITGPDIRDIFNRIRNNLKTRVPMLY
jgi:ribulose-5-phosphate 4-epimerase/fuculose-1-phosphate aldolase